MTEDNFSEEEAKEMLRQFAEGKGNVHSFFTKIIQNPDTTKVGNLDKEELGTPNLPVRSIKELELFAEDIWEDKGWASYFKKLSEIHTSTSLSKDGLLVKLSVTQKKELSDMTPRKKKKTGFFQKKEPEEN
ncbi:MAG: hypothetical protein PHX47_02505 [Candidatus ainarchaeum sp.]|nr:hypothetical protein [Candidatus ainarchaeum sp.]